MRRPRRLRNRPTATASSQTASTRSRCRCRRKSHCRFIWRRLSSSTISNSNSNKRPIITITSIAIIIHQARLHCRPQHQRRHQHQRRRARAHLRTDSIPILVNNCRRCTTTRYHCPLTVSNRGPQAPPGRRPSALSSSNSSNSIIHLRPRCGRQQCTVSHSITISRTLWRVD